MHNEIVLSLPTLEAELCPGKSHSLVLSSLEQDIRYMDKTLFRGFLAWADNHPCKPVGEGRSVALSHQKRHKRIFIS